MFGSAESKHPRLTNGEIISEEFQHNPPTSQADRQEGQVTCDRKIMLCTKAHRTVKNESFGNNML